VADWASVARDQLPIRPVALVTVLATEGSAPRGAGTRMAVVADRCAGTIGGGALEHQAIIQARAMLEHPPGSWRVQDFPLGPLLGQCCGGRVRLLVERVDPARAEWLDDPERAFAVSFGNGVDRQPVDRQAPPPATARGALPQTFLEAFDGERRPLFLFGAGHVGRAIARAAEGLPFQLAWFDTRDEAAQQPGVMLLEEADIAGCMAGVPGHAAVLIMTHDHALDYRLVRAALPGAAGFVGLIGSRTKRARFLSRLAAEGFDDATRARLTCPIGVPGIAGKEPEVIAIAVLAQLLALRGPAA
jgi:xanthine dehydrogenase accessory factor